MSNSNINLSLLKTDKGILLKCNDDKIMIYQTLNTSDMFRDLKSKLKTKKVEIDKDSLAVKVNESFMEFIETNSNKTHQPPSQNNKSSSKSKLLSCPECGHICIQIDGKENLVCVNCHREYKPNGEYVKSPWYEEPPEANWVPCNGQEIFEEVMSYIQDHVVFSDEITYLLFALWNISTYKMELFNSTGYFNFMATGNEKGKSRALDIAKEVTYRGSLLSRPTEACVGKALDDKATVLIDQAENTFYDGQRRTRIYDMWTSGYRRGIYMGQLSAVDHVSYDLREPFGPKAISMQEDGKVDNPLNSRTFNVSMQKGTPKNKNVDKKRSVRIRNMLHHFKHKEIPYDQHTFLRGRVAEIIDPLIFTARMLKLSEKLQDRVFRYALELTYEKAEEAFDTLPARVYLGVLSSQGKYDPSNPNYVSPGNVLEWIRQEYPGEYDKLSSHKVGHLMKNLGLQKMMHSTKGSIYDVTSEKSLTALDKAKSQYLPESIDMQIEEIIKQYDEKGLEINRDSLKGKPLIEQLLLLSKSSWVLERKEQMDIDQSNIDLSFMDDIVDEPPPLEVDEKYIPPEEERPPE